MKKYVFLPQIFTQLEESKYIFLVRLSILSKADGRYMCSIMDFIKGIVFSQN